MLLFLKLVFVHLCGDFILQPDAWVEDKQNRKIKSSKLYLHIAVHIGLMAVLLFDVQYIFLIIIIGLSHLLIDLSKLYLDARWPSKWWFVFDQIMHILILGLLADWKTDFWSQLDTNISYNAVMLTLVAIVMVTFFSSKVIKIMISNWTPETEDPDEDSLSNAGHYIGMLERLFVFGFVVSGNIEAVGFLLAAKSVFRFGDLKESKDRKLTEYILIGSLLSFGLAILIGVLFLYLRQHL